MDKIKYYIIFFVTLVNIVNASTILSKIRTVYLDKKTGTFIKYKYIGKDKYYILWGNNSNTHKSNKTYRNLGNGELWLRNYSKQYFELYQSTGTSASISVFIKPGNPKVIELTNVICTDLVNGRAVYYDDNIGELFVYKFNREMRQLIKIDSYCKASVSYDCIDSCKIVKNNVLIWYQGNNWKNYQEPDPQYRIEKIKI